tara:strand:- start:1164 stop:2267 length:1104 start_codon:yes stop_codon:yes gene_type:complete
MDDYSLTALSDSKNEWCARLINLLTPEIIQGLRSIFTEARNLCIENDEEEKYLMTFQTFLSRVPKWNDAIIEAERTRIEDSTNCGYLEELITCVHIIQLKALTCVRVGTEQKKVDINIPSRNEFIHRAYINSARKLYTVVYLFERDIAPLQIQKNNRELELIVKECILNSIRDTMPVEEILRAYIDETEEENVTEVVIPVEEEVTEETASNNKTVADADEDTNANANANADTNANADAEQTGSKSTVEVQKAVSQVATLPQAPSLEQTSSQESININTEASSDNIKFNDIDNAIDTKGNLSSIVAPKTEERLERIASISAERRREEEDDEEQLTIGDEVKLEINEINDLNKPATIIPPVLDDIEILQ